MKSMHGKRNRGAISVVATIGAVVSSLCLAASASAACPALNLSLGRHFALCEYSFGAEQTWTVPANITKPKFEVFGSGDAIGGGGGSIKAKLPVEAGQEIELTIGTNGEASSVSRAGEPLLVAGGGDGVESNYVSAEAELLEEVEPGGLAGGLGDGAIYIEWYDAREPFELTAPLAHVIVDIFSGEKTSFSHSEFGEEWIVPPEVHQAIFELFGGEGESGEPRGHILFGFDVNPGEIFVFFVGGHGGDTTAYRTATSESALAAGGDTERLNYLPASASPEEEFWEGGGPGSVPGDGHAIVHFWRTEAPSDPPSEGESSSQDSGSPPHLEVGSAQAAPACTVPQLLGRTVRAARRAILHANCTLGKVKRKKVRGKKKRHRVVKQRPRAGSVVAAGTRIYLVVGVRRCHRQARHRRHRSSRAQSPYRLRTRRPISRSCG